MPSEPLLDSLLLRQDTWRGRNRSLRKHVITTGKEKLDKLGSHRVSDSAKRDR